MLGFHTVVMLAAAAAAAGAPRHRVDRLEYRVDGLASDWALNAFVDLSEGDSFETEAELRWVLDRERQDLLNRRYFESVEYAVTTSTTADGNVSYAIEYIIDENLALLPLPYVLYDSNTGAEVGLELQYNNALGTLTDWRLGPYFRIRPDGELGDWEIPVELQRVKIGTLVYSLSVRQKHEQVRLGEEVEEGTGVFEVDFDVDRTQVSAATSFLWPRILLFYSISPRVEFYYNYRGRLRREQVDPSASGEDAVGREVRDDFSFGIQHEFGRSDINWRGNVRFGYRYSLRHSLSYADRNTEDTVVNEIVPSGRYYTIFAERLNYYARIQGTVALNGLSRSFGRAMRGITNTSISGDMAIVFNQTLGIDAISIGKALNVQLHPFFDFAVVRTGVDGPSEGGAREADARASAGIDLLLFLDFISGFIIRVTVGFDVGRAGQGNASDPELIFAIDPFY